MLIYQAPIYQGYGGGYLQNAFYWLSYYGITDVILPFLLIYTVTFAILQKIKILGEESKRFNVIIALVLGLSVVIPHVLGLYPSPHADVVNIINNALPNVSVFIIAIIMLFLLIGLWGGKAKWKGAGTTSVTIVSLIIMIYIFARAAGWTGQLPYWLYFLEDPNTQALLIVVIIFFIVIGYITKEPPAEGAEGTFKKIGKSLEEMFGKE